MKGFRRRLDRSLFPILLALLLPFVSEGEERTPIGISFLFDGGSIYFQIDQGRMATGQHTKVDNYVQAKELRLIVVKPGSSLWRRFDSQTKSSGSLIVGNIETDPTAQVDELALRALTSRGRLQLIGQLKKMVVENSGSKLSSDEANVIKSLIEVLRQPSSLRVWGADAEALIRSAETSYLFKSSGVTDDSIGDTASASPGVIDAND